MGLSSSFLLVCTNRLRAHSMLCMQIGMRIQVRMMNTASCPIWVSYFPPVFKMQFDWILHTNSCLRSDVCICAFSPTILDSSLYFMWHSCVKLVHRTKLAFQAVFAACLHLFVLVKRSNFDICLLLKYWVNLRHFHPVFCVRVICADVPEIGIRNFD